MMAGGLNAARRTASSCEKHELETAQSSFGSDSVTEERTLLGWAVWDAMRASDTEIAPLAANLDVPANMASLSYRLSRHDQKAGNRDVTSQAA